MRTAEVVNATSTGSRTWLRTTTAQTAITAAARQAAMKVRMGKSPSLSGALCPEYGWDAAGIKRLNVALLRCDALGLGCVGGRVDLEEKIDGGCRPIRNGNAVARSPCFDLAHVLPDQCLAQVLA